MKIWIAALGLSLISISAAAKGTMKFNYKNADILEVIKDYSVASGQKFIVDSAVRGKATELAPS